MPSYHSVPDDVLLRMAEHSDVELAKWRRTREEAREALLRADRMVDDWVTVRDDQYHALDERGLEPKVVGTSVSAEVDRG